MKCTVAMAWYQLLQVEPEPEHEPMLSLSMQVLTQIILNRHGGFSFVLVRAGAAGLHARGHMQIRNYLAARTVPEAWK